MLSRNFGIVNLALVSAALGLALSCGSSDRKDTKSAHDSQENYESSKLGKLGEPVFFGGEPPDPEEIIQDAYLKRDRINKIISESGPISKDDFELEVPYITRMTTDYHATYKGTPSPIYSGLKPIYDNVGMKYYGFEDVEYPGFWSFSEFIEESKKQIEEAATSVLPVLLAKIEVKGRTYDQLISEIPQNKSLVNDLTLEGKDGKKVVESILFSNGVERYMGLYNLRRTSN